MSASAIYVANTLAKELLTLAETKQFDKLKEKLSPKNEKNQTESKKLYVLVHDFDPAKLSEANKDKITKILIQHHTNHISSTQSNSTAQLDSLRGMIGPCSYLKIFLDPHSHYSLIERLLCCGADASINSLGSNALHHVFSDLDKSALLVKYGCNINSVSCSGFGTPVHIIIANEYEKHFFNILEKEKNNGQQFDEPSLLSRMVVVKQF